MTQPVTAGTSGDPLAEIVTDEITVNGQTVTRLVALCFDTANSNNGVVRFDGTGSTNGISDGTAKVLVNGTAKDIDSAEWIDASGTSHTVDSWEKVTSTTFTVTITGTNSPVAPGGTLDVTADISNTGSSSGTQTITLEIDNGVGQVDSTSTTVSGGGTVTKTLQWAVPSGQSQQQYTATVSSNDDTATETVDVSSVYPAAAIHGYDATKLTGLAGGDPVTTWPDQVGNADATAVGSPTYRATQINGNAAIELDGSNDAFATGYFPDTSNNITVLAVTNVTGTHYGAVFSQFNSNNENRLQLRWDNKEYRIGYGDDLASAGSAPRNTPILVTLDGRSGTVRVFDNGTLEYSIGYNGGQTPQDGELHLGARDRPGSNTVDQFLPGELGEIIIYRGLSVSERDSEETRLRNKWGV